jgi:hypothetical protein
MRGTVWIGGYIVDGQLFVFRCGEEDFVVFVNAFAEFYVVKTRGMYYRMEEAHVLVISAYVINEGELV